MKSCKIIIFLAVLFLFPLFSGSLHAAEGLIKNVTFQGKNRNSESVVFHLNGPWMPKAFALKGDAPRVVFDFVDTQLAKTVPASIDTKGTIIQKIRTGRHSNKTRVVIDLAAGGKFNFNQQFDKTKNILTIQLFPADSPVKQEEKPVVAAAPEKKTIQPASEKKSAVPEKKPVVAEDSEKKVAAQKKNPVVATAVVTKKPKKNIVEPAKEKNGPSPDPLLSDVSFENTSSKGEMVLFKLNGFYPPEVSGKEDGTPLVICDFSGTRLGKKVIKEQLSHGEFIKKISVHQLKASNVIRVTLELVANKNYDLQQIFFKEDNLFVIIVNPYNAVDKSKEQ